MPSLQRINPCLWFNDQAEEAARFYTGIFPNSSVDLITHYSDVGQEQHQRPPGSVMTVSFTLDGQPMLMREAGSGTRLATEAYLRTHGLTPALRATLGSNEAIKHAVARGLKAGELVNAVAQQVGGKGGGKPDMAMAGGTDASGLAAALASVQGWVAERV